MVLPQKWQKVVEQNGYIWFNKLHLKYKKNTCFTFALKYEGTFSLH